MPVSRYYTKLKSPPLPSRAIRMLAAPVAVFLRSGAIEQDAATTAATAAVELRPPYPFSDANIATPRADLDPSPDPLVAHATSAGETAFASRAEVSHASALGKKQFDASLKSTSVLPDRRQVQRSDTPTQIRPHP